jgi:hypothetical protein
VQKKDLAALEKVDRTVDELKDRYYKVARTLLIARGQTQHAIVSKPFDLEQEARRKYNLEKLFMRTKEQVEKEKVLLASLKKIDSKIKKEEKEERNLARLVTNDFEEVRLPTSVKKTRGVMLLSNRFQTKLPVSEPLQMQISSALAGMKIKPTELHHS